MDKPLESKRQDAAVGKEEMHPENGGE